MIGTVPIYDAVVYYHKPLIQITADEWIRTLLIEKLGSAPAAI